MSIKYLNKQIFYIDSHNRASGTHDNFEIDINLLPDKEVDSLCVMRATIKKSYYIIQDGSNTFYLKEGAQQALITVPEGNYSATSFRTVLAPLLNAASLTMSGYTYAITIPTGLTTAQTGKFTYTSTGNDSAFVIDYYLFEQLGFDPNQTVSFVNGSLTSETGLNFQVKSTLNIHSNMVGGLQSDIIQEISTTGSDFIQLKYECFDYEANSLPFIRNGNRYRFTMLDEDHNPIDLTLNVLITVMVYKRNDILDKLSKTVIDYIKYLVQKEIELEAHSQETVVQKDPEPEEPES